MTDLFRSPWNRIIPTALTAFVFGWFAGSATTGWVPIAAWVLAVVATTLVVAATIDSGYRREREQHRVEVEAARRRVLVAVDDLAAVRVEVCMMRDQLDGALKALRMANRLRSSDG